MLRFRCVRGSRTPLVGRLLLTLLVPNDTVAGMCHALFPDSAMTPAKKWFAGAHSQGCFHDRWGARAARALGLLPTTPNVPIFTHALRAELIDADGAEPVLDVI